MVVIEIIDLSKKNINDSNNEIIYFIVGTVSVNDEATAMDVISNCKTAIKSLNENLSVRVRKDKTYNKEQAIKALMTDTFNYLTPKAR